MIGVRMLAVYTSCLCLCFCLCLCLCPCHCLCPFSCLFSVFVFVVIFHLVSSKPRELSQQRVMLNWNWKPLICGLHSPQPDWSLFSHLDCNFLLPSVNTSSSGHSQRKVMITIIFFFSSGHIIIWVYSKDNDDNFWITIISSEHLIIWVYSKNNVFFLSNDQIKFVW